jgi:spermidine synthase
MRPGPPVHRPAQVAVASRDESQSLRRRSGLLRLAQQGGNYTEGTQLRMIFYLVIFCSGAAILALELLASRVMTPYFGVSLYIWTGILSITLIALALGYWAGGRITRGNPAHSLTRMYALMPAAAALAIVTSCLVYPYAFSPLANWSLLAGAFAACLLLLFVPLVLTSAMNPLLVAIDAASAKTSGDAGSGRIFFVSTVGSVAGVLITAFGLIPYLTNYVAVLLIALTLALLSLAMALFPPATLRSRNVVMATAIVAAGSASVLMWRADAYTGRLGPVAYAGQNWRIEATLGSLFGTVKILRSEPDGGTGLYQRIYFHDGMTQNTVDSTGASMSFYTYALEGLARGYRPGMKNVLALGMGAGIVPMRLAELGASVDVVEINPVSLAVAQRYFGYDPARVHTHITDARTYVRACPQRYDVVVVDLFQGDGTPEYLVTREFFHDLKQCLTARGVAVFNTFADLERPATYAHLLVTLRSELPHLALYRPDWPDAIHINSFLVASAAPLPEKHAVVFDHVPPRHRDTLFDMLARPAPLTPALFEGGRIVSDAHNAAAHDLALTEVIYRRAVVENLPAALLLN